MEDKHKGSPIPADRILTIILIVFTCSVIFYLFPFLPKNLALDELEFARLAHKLGIEPYAVYHRYATGHATLYFYVLLASFKLFGESVFALRLPAALFGFSSVMIFYGILRTLFQDAAIRLKSWSTSYAFAGALLFAATRWSFQFSRFAFEASFLIFLELCSLFFFFRYLKSDHKKHILLVLSGVCAGLAFHSYIPGRLFIIVLILGLIHYSKKDLIPNLLYLVGSFSIITSPLVIYLLTHQDVRVVQQFYWSRTTLTFIDKCNMFFDNVLKTAMMFFWKGDINGRHNYPLKPALNPIALMMFLLGWLSIIRSKIRTETVIFIAYFVIALLPTLLTNPSENPNMLRTVTVVPSIVYGMILGLRFFLEKGEQTVHTKWAVAVIGMALLLLCIGYDIRTYFVYQRSVFPQSFEIQTGLKTINEELPY